MDRQEVLAKIETLEKVLTEYSKYLEKRGYMDSDWYTEENTVEEFLNIK
jgi:hypothetical protein